MKCPCLERLDRWACLVLTDLLIWAWAKIFPAPVDTDP
jgi:hypothetical protein